MVSDGSGNKPGAANAGTTAGQPSAASKPPVTKQPASSAQRGAASTNPPPPGQETANPDVELLGVTNDLKALEVVVRALVALTPHSTTIGFSAVLEKLLEVSGDAESKGEARKFIEKALLTVKK